MMAGTSIGSEGVMGSSGTRPSVGRSPFPASYPTISSAHSSLAS